MAIKIAKNFKFPGSSDTYQVNATYLNGKEMPETLPNPHPLKVGSKSYDGSTEITIGAADLGLTSAMIFRGTTTTAISNDATTNPIKINSADFTAKSGDVVLSGNKEFVFDGSRWKELGDQGSHALKTITISAGSGLTGGGDLSANRTISHADTSTQESVTASGRRYITGVTLDTYGHVTGLTTGTETVANQNAFSKVKVGTTTVEADSPTDTLELVGSNVTLTPDATNDKVTIGITKSNVTTALGYTPPDKNTTYTFATGSADGTISVTPSGGTPQNVSVKGLGALAYKSSLSAGDVGAAPSSHAHGNITSTGTITSTAVTTATGVLVYDSSNKIQRATAAKAREIIGAATTSGNNTFTGKNIFTASSSFDTVDTQKFVVGDSSSAFVFGSDGLQTFAGTNSTTPKGMYINYYGGDVNIGSGVTGTKIGLKATTTIYSSTSDTALSVQSKAASSYIGFNSNTGATLGYYGVNSVGQPVFYNTKDNIVLHAGNVSSFAAPKYQYSTTDPGAGSALTTGTLYLVYE